MFDLARLTDSRLVAQIDYHESIGSTSDRALELGARGEAKLPLLVLTQQQTAGRGRGANRWWSADGALTFSLVLEAPADRLQPTRWPQVALIAGVAICQALEQFAPAAELRVKWPNDVYLAGRKICGILSESIPGWRDRLVVGIGINVNNRVQGSGFTDQDESNSSQESHAPSHHSPLTAASLIDHDGRPRDLTNVLLTVLDEFDRRWRDLLDGNVDAAATDYRQRCFLMGKTVTIEQPGGQRLIGVCRGIDDLGRLRVQTETGEQAIISGTVTHWQS